ncbi:Protein FAM133 [Liparis tanakae]|uniref:Protein FAM133 n=1 Tax=Liparis tanakae TaxID=230148 RepID=A0A4Z2H9P2_9TELE|nr:Protein FAM133 [Liparis tanakae]
MGKRDNRVAYINPIAASRSRGPANNAGPTIQDYLGRPRPTWEELKEQLEKKKKGSRALADFEDKMNVKWRKELAKNREKTLAGIEKEKEKEKKTIEKKAADKEKEKDKKITEKDKKTIDKEKEEKKEKKEKKKKEKKKSNRDEKKSVKKKRKRKKSSSRIASESLERESDAESKTPAGASSSDQLATNKPRLGFDPAVGALQINAAQRLLVRPGAEFCLPAPPVLAGRSRHRRHAAGGSGRISGSVDRREPQVDRRTLLQSHGRFSEGTVVLKHDCFRRQETSKDDKNRKRKRKAAQSYKDSSSESSAESDGEEGAEAKKKKRSSEEKEKITDKSKKKRKRKHKKHGRKKKKNAASQSDSELD